MAGKGAEFRPNEELSRICQELWDLDDNRLKPGVDYVIDLQGGTKGYWREDKAKDPLFSYMNEKILQKPTFKSFIALLDNYETSTGVLPVWPSRPSLHAQPRPYIYGS
jgi:poly(U)-specific endoribonuclease